MADDLHQELKMRQEFTHISTLQENGYIEGFFSNIRRDLLSKTVFESYYEAKQKISVYMHYYNNKRKHHGIGKITPQQKWETGWVEKSKFASSDEAEAGFAEEQPARNNLTSGKEGKECCKALFPFRAHFHCQMLPKTLTENINNSTKLFFKLCPNNRGLKHMKGEVYYIFRPNNRKEVK